MGWINYIVVPQWKVKIQVNRETDSLSEHVEKSLETLADGLEELDIYEIKQKKLTDLTAGDFEVLMKCGEICSSLEQFDLGQLMLFWLNRNDAEYVIVSEHDPMLTESEAKDYLTIGWWTDE